MFYKCEHIPKLKLSLILEQAKPEVVQEI
jgi:hypothetical protein